MPAYAIRDARQSAWLTNVSHIMRSVIFFLLQACAGLGVVPPREIASVYDSNGGPIASKSTVLLFQNVRMVRFRSAGVL